MDKLSELTIDQVDTLKKLDLYHLIELGYYSDYDFQEFYNDLIHFFGVENNPKVSKCFDLAWEKSHSFGYSEVFLEFSDVIELIK